MRILTKQIARKIIAFLMIGMVGFLVINKTVFIHVHKLSDGTIIVHAHPFNKSSDSQPIKTHHHSNAEFFFFKNLGLLFPILFLVVTHLMMTTSTLVFNKIEVKYHLGFINLAQDRAPPVQ